MPLSYSNFDELTAEFDEIYQRSLSNINLFNENPCKTQGEKVKECLKNNCIADCMDIMNSYRQCLTNTFNEKMNTIPEEARPISEP